MEELKGKQGEIKIYTTPWCPYCVRAIRLLDKKGVAYENINVSSEPEIRASLYQITRQTSVPQVFIHGKSVGGCDDLYALDAAGNLDGLLSQVQP